MALSMIVLLVVWLPLYARTFRDRIIEYRLEQQARDIENGGHAESVSLLSGVGLVSDLVYGKDNQQRMDVYLPQQAKRAPVIFMVRVSPK